MGDQSNVNKPLTGNGIDRGLDLLGIEKIAFHHLDARVGTPDT